MRARALACLVAIATASTPAHADRGDRWDPVTMAAQAGGGLLGFTLGAGLFGLVGYELGKTDGKALDWGGLAGAVIGGAIGGATGLVVGVDITGDDEHGTGHWWGTTLGLIDAGATIALLARLRPKSDGGRLAVIIVGGLVLLAVPIVGYQLSGDAHAAPTVVPLMSLTF